jgi:hypothetical protein
MAEDTHDEHEHKPRWDKIEQLHDVIDKSIDDSFKKDSLSFMEVDFALLMINEKIAQQKIELYNLYMKEHDGESKESPDTMYR